MPFLVAGDARAGAAERFEPRRVQGKWKARAGSGESHTVLSSNVRGREDERGDAGHEQERDGKTLHEGSSVGVLHGSRWPAPGGQIRWNSNARLVTVSLRTR